jgi:hypothetical protein
MSVTEDWRCSACNETVPAGFDACWNCGADRAGTPDPSFVPAVGLVAQSHCRSCGYLLHGLPSTICPECGTPFDPAEKDTLRDKTPPVSLVAAVFGVVAGLFGVLMLLCAAVGVALLAREGAQADRQEVFAVNVLIFIGAICTFVAIRWIRGALRRDGARPGT